MNTQRQTDPLPTITPSAAGLVAARARWKQLCESEEERNRFLNRLQSGVGPWWYPSWTNNSLLLRKHVVASAGSAFGTPQAKTRDANYSDLQLRCEGEQIAASESPCESDVVDELAYIMARVCRLLNWEQCDANGSAQFVHMFRRETSLYETDCYTWAIETAQKIQRKQFDELAPEDWEFVAEEIDDLGKRQRDALQSQMVRLLLHLLKWRFASRAGRENSWRASIKSARMDIAKILDKNPGLKGKVDELYDEAYGDAIVGAIEETNLPESAFPDTLPWTYEQAMAADFMPEPVYAA
ncbi:MAG: DUF29 domain-containing protein [Candidatus Binataceae bacterium]